MEKINDTEMKARFFAQYWGQKILSYTNHTVHNVVDENVLSPSNNNLKHAFLKLIPLSLISDEDAIEVVKIVETLGIRSSAMRDPQKFLDPMKRGEGTTHKVAHVVDYLRSKGYALPYLNYSVQDLISMGWIKLTES